MLDFKPFHFTVRYDHEEYECDLIPIVSPVDNGIPSQYELFMNRTFIGVIEHESVKWKCDALGNQRLADALGDNIEEHYRLLNDTDSAQ